MNKSENNKCKHVFIDVYYGSEWEYECKYCGMNYYSNQKENKKHFKAIEYLKENKKFLSIRAIEQYLEMPDSTLIKAVNGVQSLPKKYEERLSNFLKSVGKNLKEKL